MYVITDDDVLLLLLLLLQLQRIRGFMTMRYINLRFTYLLTSV